MGPINNGPLGPGPCPPGPYGPIGAPGIVTQYNGPYYTYDLALCSCSKNTKTTTPSLMDLMIDFIHHRWDVLGCLMTTGSSISSGVMSSSTIPFGAEIVVKFNGRHHIILKVEPYKNTIAISEPENLGMSKPGHLPTYNFWQPYDVTDPENWKIIEAYIDKEMISIGVGKGGHRQLES
jgi:hypothetical protein